MSQASEKSENSPREAPKRGELPPGLQKICGVCGDRALGYNFNAVSCESCKAFFRRNAVTTKQFKCPFSNNCEITVVKRRFCQKCRLEKCFSIGMVKEYIMTEDDKAEKRRKIEENRARKRPQRDSDEEVTSSKHLKREDDPISPGVSSENSPTVSQQSPSVIQYDVLNSTTSSPTGPVHSPLLREVDSQAASPYPRYSQPQDYSQYQPTYYQEPRTPSQVSCSVPDSGLYDGEYQSENTIRSILTSQGKGVRTESARMGHDSCEESASTSYQNVNKAQDILEDVERIRIEPNSIESIMCEAIKLEFEAYSTVGHGNSSSRELNEVERAKLNELIVANKALHAPIDMDIATLFEGANDLKCTMPVALLTPIERDYSVMDGKHDPMLLTIINLTAVAIRRLIKMAKKINAFKNMCEEDQIALLKGGCTEMMVLRSTITYDGARKTWKIPHRLEDQSNIKTDVLKLAKGNIYHAHECFIRSFDPRVRTDENIILIMSAILLFTPDRPKVVHRDVIKLEQNSYYYLLRRYLESVYPGCEAKSIFLKLIQKIMELHRLAQEVIGVYLDVNPIEPLLMEIFDLKQHTT